MTDNLVLQTPAPSGSTCVAALYHFATFPRCAEFREPLQALCDEQGVKGTLLLAREGINGTIAGSDAGIATVLAHLRAQPEFAGLEHTRKAARRRCLSCG